MRQKCTQPVTPSATHTCTVPLPSTMMSAISSSRLGTDASTVISEEHGIVDAAAEVAGRHAEQQRDGNDHRLVRPPISSATRAPFSVR